MAHDRKRFPIMRYDPATPPRTAVLMALGAASVAYVEPPTSPFDAERVKQIGDELCDLLGIEGGMP